MNSPVEMGDIYEELSAHTPKMGARIRDDYGQSLVGKTEGKPTVKEERETATAVYIPALTEGGQCLQEASRNVLWRTSTTGSVMSASCPAGTSGIATRECEATGWGRAQLGECKGSWLSSIVASYRAAPATSPHLSSLLKQKIATESLYGGDIISLFDLFESSARNFQFHTTSEGGNESSDVKELKNLLASLSALLEHRSVAAWLDLAPIEFEFQRTRFIGILQELGLLALDASKLDTTLRTNNFGEETDFQIILDRGVIDVRLLSGFSVISLLQEGAEGVKSGSDFSTISLGVTQFLKSLTRNSPRLVLLEVSKVDTLFSISDRQQLAQIDGARGDPLLEGEVRILSQVVSVFAKNVKNRYMSEGINITLKHLAVQKDVKKVSH